MGFWEEERTAPIVGVGEDTMLGVCVGEVVEVWVGVGVDAVEVAVGVGDSVELDPGMARLL